MAALVERIAAEIDEVGPLPFEQFMDIALYDPAGGFFATGSLRSARDGDFLTSAEVSPLFGETIARYVTAVWDRAGRPDEFIVCDVGAGSGSLLEPLLAALPFEARAFAVEVSPAARDAFAAGLPQCQVLCGLDELPDALTGVIVANELLDNLPMAVAVRESGSWVERWVGVDAGRLVLVASPARPAVVGWLERWAGPVPDGGVVEVQLAASSWVRSAVERIERGGLLVFDYGNTAAELSHRRSEGTLRTYRGHHLGPHPLDEPGTTDITADVNFSAMLDAARDRGAEAHLMRQDDFLRAWGLDDARSTLRARELELARTDRILDRMQARTRFTEADTLMHPRGLGDFRVLIVEK